MPVCTAAELKVGHVALASGRADAAVNPAYDAFGVDWGAVGVDINGEDRASVRTRLEQVMVKEGDVWKVASFHNVAIHPAFAKGPPAS